MLIDGLDEFGHLGEGFGTGDRGARTENLTAAMMAFPPKRNPVPAPTGLAFLQTAMLEAPASETNGRTGKRLDIHGPDHSIGRTKDRVFEDEKLRMRGPKRFSL